VGDLRVLWNANEKVAAKLYHLQITFWHPIRQPRMHRAGSSKPMIFYGVVN
jgi:hypothetical protein